tara:strand:+ start:380 stop:691 length:312 start_codon:yes stop_codon:yes gene_type:complete
MATNKSKAKGNRFERKIVEICELHDLKAVRAWGSNGLALGQHPECDVLINDEIKVQAKCRKKLAAHIQPNENVDVQIVKQDRGPTMVIMEINDFLLMYKKGLK